MPKHNKGPFVIEEGIRIRTLDEIFTGGASGPHGPRPGIVKDEIRKRKDINRLKQAKRQRRLSEGGS